MVIWWTGGSKAVRFRSDGSGGCRVCRSWQPFTLFVQYHTSELFACVAGSVR